jgi:hypothetical protein
MLHAYRTQQKGVVQTTATTNTHSTTNTNNASKPRKVTYNLVKRFDDLIARTENWNVGAYKTANDQLYDLLAETFDLYLHVVNGDADVRKQFNKLLKARKVLFQDNTPIQTRVVRLVFAIDRKRAYTYANVLRAARAANKTASEIPNWIREFGGVQEVAAKGNDSLSTAAKAKSDAEFASDALAKAIAISDLGALPAILKPGEAQHPTYSIALVRSEGGSSGEIVWGTNNATLITRVLALAGKELSKKADEATKANVERDVVNKRRAARKTAAKKSTYKARPSAATTKRRNMKLAA